MNISKQFLASPIFEGLTQEDVIKIQQVGSHIDVAPHVDIIKEGETSEGFFIILNGKVDVLKRGEQQQNSSQFHLTTLSEGSIGGEISFVDNQPGSATLRTITPTRLLWITQKSLLRIPKETLNRFVRNIAKFSLNRLKSFNHEYLTALQATFDLMQKRRLFGELFIVLLSLFSLVSITEYIVKMLNFNITSTASSMTRILIIISPCIYWILKNKIPLRNFGISRENWKISFFEGMGLGLVLGISGMFIDSFYDKATFQDVFFKFVKNFDLGIWILAYALSSFIQEFFLRGVLQTSIQEFLNDQNGYYSVFVTSIGFAGVHVHKGWFFAVLAFLGGCCLGFFYLRRPNLIGVSTCHFIMGISTFPITAGYS